MKSGEFVSALVSLQKKSHVRILFRSDSGSNLLLISENSRSFAVKIPSLITLNGAHWHAAGQSTYGQSKICALFSSFWEAPSRGNRIGFD